MAMTGGAKVEEYLDTMGSGLATARAVRMGWLQSAVYDDGKPVAMIAAIMELGAPSKGIPPRPTLGPTATANWSKWTQTLGFYLKKHKGNAFAALAETGDVMASDERQAIVDLVGPPNSPVTDLLKQRFPTRDGMTFADVLKARADVKNGATAPAGKPLIWSGHMLGSVNYEVV